jgi:plastocyanin
MLRTLLHIIIASWVMSLTPSMLFAATIDVSITGSGFSPSSVSISEGDTVRWTNNDSATRNVSSDAHPTHTNYAPLNLGNVSPSGTLSLVFPTAGTYTYHDHINASFTGSVTVSIPPPPSPSPVAASAVPTTPVFSSITTAKTDTTSATLAWSTERPSFTQLEYGITSGTYTTQTAVDASLTYLHTVTLTNLGAGMTYFARAIGGNALDQRFTSNEVQFTTTALPVIPVTTIPPSPLPITPPTLTPTVISTPLVPLPGSVRAQETRSPSATNALARVAVRHFTAGDMLRPNVSNTAVRRLQEFLARSPDLYPEGLVTGYYGTLTRRAVERFQKKHGIVSTGDPVSTGFGAVGPRTRTAINALIGE